MVSVYARGRSTEAPMTGIEFTNRSKVTPAWRVNSGNSDANINENTGAGITCMKSTRSFLSKSSTFHVNGGVYHTLYVTYISNYPLKCLTHGNLIATPNINYKISFSYNLLVLRLVHTVCSLQSYLM